MLFWLSSVSYNVYSNDYGRIQSSSVFIEFDWSMVSAVCKKYDGTDLYRPDFTIFTPDRMETVESGLVEWTTLCFVQPTRESVKIK